MCQREYLISRIFKLLLVLLKRAYFPCIVVSHKCFTSILFFSASISLSLLRPFATSNRRGKLEPKCVPQLLLGSLLGTCQSARGQSLFFLSLVTTQEALTKVNWAQFPSRFFSNECRLLAFSLFSVCNTLRIHGSIAGSPAHLRFHQFNTGRTE